MSTTKTVLWSIGGILLIIFTVGLILLLRKASTADRIKIQSVTPSIDKDNATLPSFLSGSVPLNIAIRIGNYAPVKYLLNQASIDLYTTDGTLIASQSEPLKKPIPIESNDSTTLTIQYTINPTVIANKVGKNIPTLLGNYITQGKFGYKAKLVGFIVAESIKKEINEEVTI